MGGAIGFIADKEVVVCPWEKKPDVELVDPTGELLTIDITLSALHQEAIKSRTEVFKRARAVKNKVTRVRTNTGAFSQSRLAFHSF